MHPRRHLLLALLCLPSPAFAADSGNAEPRSIEAQQARLESLRERLHAVESEMAETDLRMDATRGELERIEIAIAAARDRRRSLEREIATKLETLETLRERAERHAEQVRGQRTALAREVRAAYIAARTGGPFKLLLNQEDPQRLARVLVYHERLGRARAERIQALTEALEGLHETRQAVKLETNKLARLRAEARAELERIAARRERREALLARLEREREGQAREHERLHSDTERVARLIDELRDALAETRAAPTGGAPFVELEGELYWPVQGSIAHGFGSPRGNAALRWQGVLIRAAAGTQVRAIAAGRVVFADWFKHLGLLIIVDHGDHYMSLYGHNRNLYKSVGDAVAAGEVLADVGSTGGQRRAGLYFEVRHEGVPQDPARWCAAPPAAREG